jgi:uncharacterized protein
MSNAQTIRTIYDAFQRGDVPAILANVTEDVDWNNTGVASRECPWNGDFSTKAKLPGFFQAVGESLDIRVFDAQTFIENGERVAVLLASRSPTTPSTSGPCATARSAATATTTTPPPSSRPGAADVTRR